MVKSLLPEHHYVYLVNCANDTLYTGYTQNVERRLAQHNAGQGGRYTRINGPVSLLAVWSFNNRREARRAECTLKRCSPDRKLLLATSANSWKEATHIH